MPFCTGLLPLCKEVIIPKGTFRVLGGKARAYIIVGGHLSQQSGLYAFMIGLQFIYKFQQVMLNRFPRNRTNNCFGIPNEYLLGVCIAFPPLKF